MPSASRTLTLVRCLVRATEMQSVAPPAILCAASLICWIYLASCFRLSDKRIVLPKGETRADQIFEDVFDEDTQVNIDEWIRKITIQKVAFAVMAATGTGFTICIEQGGLAVHYTWIAF